MCVTLALPIILGLSAVTPYIRKITDDICLFLRKSQLQREIGAVQNLPFHFGQSLPIRSILAQLKTPPKRSITPTKKGKTQAEKDSNKKKSKGRVYIEQYLGRVYQKNGIFNGVYRHDHSHFDLDFENACLLINEDVNVSELTLEDGEFYQKLLDERLEKWKMEEEKRKRGYEKYKRSKKAKVAKVQSM